MLDLHKKSVVVPCVVVNANQQRFSVEGLLASIQRHVQDTRSHHPELVDYYLHDVSLRVRQDALLADLDFRK